MPQPPSKRSRSSTRTPCAPVEAPWTPCVDRRRIPHRVTGTSSRTNDSVGCSTATTAPRP